ncbi:MAG: UvrD-helicase domain-containing protein [Firmicutes bacterium]|nr:UvrD-helicase domain-containing protein [Bacillota bacterium]
MFIADLHIHSAYSRATSRDLLPVQLEASARRKGIHLVASGDFTHLAWRQLLQESLEPAEEGLYRLKEDIRIPDSGVAADRLRPRFILSGEISSIYKKNGRTRKVHNVILLPSLEAAERLSQRLEKLGCNLRSDGRPIIGLDSRDLLEMSLDCCEDAIFIPAHIWTPHFSVLGAYSGFDSIEECFEDLTAHIWALETGLSSDPPMNWRLSQLDRYTLVSNSDAHSPDKLGREANLFRCELSYPHLLAALKDRDGSAFQGTIEFFPAEGKYHFNGHRNCKQCLSPQETIARQGLCPVCRKPLTLGVAHRVEELADREEGFQPENARPFESLVPLAEVIGASLAVGPGSGKVREIYRQLLRSLGPEFYILREAPLEDIQHLSGPCVAESIHRLRQGKIELSPGYDGEYGKVSILSPEDIDRLNGQATLFSGQSFLPAKAEKPAEAGKPLEAAADSEEIPPSGKAGIRLNPSQLQAATSLSPALAVIAGPGCGKTRTLVSRISWLIEQGTPPQEITAVTFTNKAGRELRERLADQVGPASRLLHIGTFHSLALQRAKQAGLSPHLLDAETSQELARQVLEKEKADISVKQLLAQVSRAKNREAAENDSPSLVAAYQQLQKNYNAWDFDDLLLYALEEAEGENADRSAFRYLLVDEFQDIDLLQYQLIRAWSKGGSSLFVIGDPDQSIYGFRGADPLCFQRLQQDYPQLEIHRLRDNYRSTPQILSAAAHVLPAASGELSAHGEKGPAVRLLRCDSPLNEGIAIAKEISHLIGGTDMLSAHSKSGGEYGLNDIAVLYRTHQQAEILAHCLETEGIPYRLSGKGDFQESPAVQAVLSFFRLLEAPGDQLRLACCLRKAQLPEEDIESILSLRPAKDMAALLRGIGKLNDLSQPTQDWLKLLKNYNMKRKKTSPARLLEGYIQDALLTGAAGLDELLGMALLYHDLTQFLQDAGSSLDGDLWRCGGRIYRSEAVTLMTLHAAKGLEYPVVLLSGARDGLLPLRRPGLESNLEEERRLFYVGMTRAGRELVLCGGEPVSPFVEAIPKELLRVEEGRKQRPKEVQLSLFGDL